MQTFTWNKPIAASHVYMLLIGGGGAGDGTIGGGSGAVTVWYGAAQNVPNSLVITPASAVNGTATTVSYRGSSLIALISADTANGSTGGSAFVNNAFGSSGFFKSVSGMNGSDTSITVPSTTTFLSGGGAGGSITANYGYVTTTNNFFQLQPIIVGTGGVGQAGSILRGGTGCGGGASSTIGSNGMVLIASW